MISKEERRLRREVLQAGGHPMVLTTVDGKKRLGPKGGDPWPKKAVIKRLGHVDARIAEAQATIAHETEVIARLEAHKTEVAAQLEEADS